MGTATDHRTDLVDLVDEHDAVARLLDDPIDRRVDAELLTPALEQPADDPFTRMAALRFLGQDVGVHPDLGRTSREIGVRGEEALDRSHQGGLARTGRADQQHVARRQARELLGQGDRHLLDGTPLADHSPAQSVRQRDRSQGRVVHETILGAAPHPVCVMLHCTRGSHLPRIHQRWRRVQSLVRRSPLCCSS